MSSVCVPLFSHAFCWSSRIIRQKLYPKKPLNQDSKTTGGHLVSHGVPTGSCGKPVRNHRGFFRQGVSTTSQFLLHAGGSGSVFFRRDTAIFQGWLEVGIWSSHVFGWGKLMIDVEYEVLKSSQKRDQTSYMVGLLDRCLVNDSIFEATFLVFIFVFCKPT